MQQLTITPYELDALKPLVEAAYASYFMKTHLLLKSGDSSAETKNWHELSSQLLMSCQSDEFFQ